MNQPLRGRRIVVTRAAEQAEPLAARLRALGAEPMVVPLIEIVQPSDGGNALDAALKRLERYDWLVVTSPNGAMAVRDALAALPGGSRPRVAAVGSATAEALGAAADLVPEEQLGTGLVAAFPTGNGSVLVAQAEGAGAVVEEGIAQKGWHVEVVAAYRTVPVVPSAGVLLRVLSADAVLFASGSAVRAWTTVFGTETPPVTVAIGPSTARVAAELGLKIEAIAADHSLDGLVGELLTQLTQSN